MPQVSLKEYAASIAQMIQGGNVDTAVAHCRHVLSHYPKYLPAYQLLAHACLEKGDLAHASHFFQCVLSVDPEDADAWMNLALLSDDLGELEQATWLMERAFDVVPGNAQVRNHLRQLYTRRDGLERARIKLSGGALARLYAVGGFYREATEELRKLLQDGTDLPPLHVAQLEVTLARALWHIQGMAPMADQVCQSLTSRLPNCLQANLIMAQIRSSAGREGEAEPYLAVVRSVDPEGSHAFDLLGDRSPVPQTAVEIPYLEFEARPTMVEHVEATGPRGEDTSWLDRIGEAIEASPETVSPVSEQALPPAWLKEWTADQAPVIPPASVELSQEPGPRAEESAVPDWIQGIGVSESAEMAAAEPVAEEDLPDWLRELGTEAVLEEEPGMGLGTLERVEGPGLETLAQLPLQGAAEVPAAGHEEVTSTAPGPELPEWLQELSVVAPPQGEPELTTGAEQVVRPPAQEKLPDWLAELGADAGSDEQSQPSAVAGVAPQVAGHEELAGWLQELSPEAKAEEPAESTTLVESTAEPVAEEELPDWLRELRSEGVVEELVSPEERVAVEPAAEEELPDWLRRLGAVDEALQESEPAALGEFPMQEKAALAGEQIAAEVVPVPDMPERTEGMPSWLAELEAEIAGRSTAAVGEVEPPVVSGVTALPVGLEEQEVVGPPVEQLEEARLHPEEAVTGPPLAGEPAVAEEIEPTPAVEMETPLPMAEVPPISTGMPEWLTQLEQELGRGAAVPTYETGEGEELAQAETAEVEPLWSEEPGEPAGGALAPAEEAVRAEAAREQPEWLAAPLDGQMSEITVEEMPEWLRQLHATEAAAEQVEAAEIGPTAQTLAKVPTGEQGGRPQDLPQTPVLEPEESQLGQAVPGLGLSVEGPLPTVAAGPAEESPAQVPQALGYLVEPASAQDDYQARVALARAYVRAGNLDASAQEYEQLARVPSVSGILVKDLEDLVASHPDRHALHRVLGDAYMRTGRLQDALNAYKEALTRL